MKVLHMLMSNSFSGAENVVCQIISMCRGDAEFVYASPDGRIKDALAERGIEFVPVSSVTPHAFSKVIKEVKPDIIHAHDMGASFMAALACGNIPLICHIHNNCFSARKLSLRSVLFKRAAKKAKHIFWVSRSAFESYRYHEKYRDKSSVLYNVVEADKLRDKAFSDKNDYSYDMVFLGRMSYPKNPERLLGIFKKITALKPNARLAVIGSGELDDEVKKLADELSLGENLEFLGFMNNPYKILHDSRLMIMTSRWEGTPMCALEAMALGVPIVSTPTDGLRELVKDGETGYLSDDDDTIAARCIEILENAELRAQLSENTLTRAAEILNSDAYRKSIIEAYTSALKTEKQDKAK